MLQNDAAKIKHVAFLSNAVSVCAKIWWVGHLHEYLDLLRAILNKITVTMETGRFCKNFPKN